MKKLNSVLKNVPIELKNEISKYRTENSLHSIRWKARQPVDDCPQGIKDNYNDSGSLPFRFAKSADLYIDFDDKYFIGYKAGSEKVEKEIRLKEGYKTDCLRMEDDIRKLHNRVRELVNASNDKHKEKMNNHYSTFVKIENLERENREMKGKLETITAGFKALLNLV